MEKRIPYLEDTLGVWLFSSGKGSDSSKHRKPEVTLKKAALTWRQQTQSTGSLGSGGCPGLRPLSCFRDYSESRKLTASTQR